MELDGQITNLALLVTSNKILAKLLVLCASVFSSVKWGQ
jgi:hypothetical protein